MLTSEEKALLDCLMAYFDRLVPTQKPVEPSLNILVRVLAGAMVCEMGARGMGEAAVEKVVGPYQRLLDTWVREGLAHVGRHRPGS
jgi:hypothetical protein